PSRAASSTASSTASCKGRSRVRHHRPSRTRLRPSRRLKKRFSPWSLVLCASTPSRAGQRRECSAPHHQGPGTRDQGPETMPISGLLAKFKKGLAKTAQLFNVRSWFGRKVDQSFLDDLEAQLIQADVGVAATAQIIERVRA